ncbi:MAG: UDP-N-acetylmuramoyl-L-alanyl-D-glutamate--2,6-diaminopimelate ligase [Clostridia bacterium]|nr:UDP-N-acetylmuramoyl-L-alanyl-D-glutamate--2,6-diaminopimelate ligase [Clostridia bacterium]
MKLKELLNCVDSQLAEIEISGITSDTRKLKKGDLFVCIEGFNFDGHKFAVNAEEQGAAVIVAQRDTGAKNQVIVEDTRAFLAEASAKWFGYPAKNLKIIGVTGTNGKTSVTYMIKSVLEAKGHKVGLIGTIHNMIGNTEIPSSNTTPGAYELNSLLSLMKEAGCEYVTMEVSSHALDQKRVHGIEFETAVFTNLTQDHLDYHITMENYFSAKEKLFSMCKTAIVNFDDEYGRRLVDNVTCKTVTFSVKSDNSTYSAKNISYRPDGVSYSFVGYNTIQNINISVGGKFSVYNSMAAVAVLLELGFELKDISAELSKMEGVKGRAEAVPTGKDFTVIIDYAHTPDGLVNILRTFSGFDGHRVVILFGCGGDRDKTKRPIMAAAAAQYADYCIVTSDNPRSEEPMSIIEDILVGFKGKNTPYKVIENRVEAIKYAIKKAQKNDIIVLAGKGHETYQILKDKTIHLDEREIVKEALDELK